MLKLLFNSKESLKMELRLMEAKHEANRTKEETERQAVLEREVCSNYCFSHNMQVKDVLALQDRK